MNSLKVFTNIHNRFVCSKISKINLFIVFVSKFIIIEFSNYINYLGYKRQRAVCDLVLFETNKSLNHFENLFWSKTFNRHLLMLLFSLCFWAKTKNLTIPYLKLWEETKNLHPPLLFFFIKCTYERERVYLNCFTCQCWQDKTGQIGSF